MANQKLVELYAVILILCAAVLFFGLFQMQANLNAVMSGQEVSSFTLFLQGIQVAALGLVVGTGILFIFLRRIRKKNIVLRKKHKKLNRLHSALSKKYNALKKKTR